LLCFILTVGLMTQCEKYGGRGGPQEPDEDSDRPEWAGGNTDSNTHIKGNDDSGTTRGGDYGDLYVLLRDEDNGVPQLVEINEEFYVIPLDEFGDPITRFSDETAFGEEYNADEELWGELTDPSAVLEVDFGRLNIVRSPTSVLDQALAEALKVLDADGAIISQDFCGRLISTYTDPATNELIAKTIDAPRENMAIYRTIMQDLTDSRLSFLAGTGEGEDPLDPLMVAAACFAGGSDKTGFVDVDEVVYINGFMDCIGNNPIENEYELDFNNESKWYYNFSEPMEGQASFMYDRKGTFDDRYIQFLVWNNVYYPVDENGDSEGPIISVWEVFEGDCDGRGWQGIGEQPEFTYKWGDLLDTGVQGFANAVDDAVQVLDFVHGDSNIRFLPGYVPE